MAFCFSVASSNICIVKNHIYIFTGNEQLKQSRFVLRIGDCVALAANEATTFKGAFELEGKWKTELENTIVEFTSKSGVIYGYIIASDNKKSVGVLIIKSVTALKNNKYECEIYDPKFKKYFNASMEFLDQDSLQIKATCCLGLFSETYVWVRQ